MSEKYRLMIYFAHSTLVMYSATIVSSKEMNVGEFMEQNKDVIKRVVQEGLNIFNYDLSYNQIGTASYTYLNSKYYPQSVKNTDAYELKP